MCCYVFLCSLACSVFRTKDLEIGEVLGQGFFGRAVRVCIRFVPCVSLSVCVFACVCARACVRARVHVLGGGGVRGRAREGI